MVERLTYLLMPSNIDSREKRLEMESRGADLQECLLFACYRGDKFVQTIENCGLCLNISSRFNYIGEFNYTV